MQLDSWIVDITVQDSGHEACINMCKVFDGHGIKAVWNLD